MTDTDGALSTLARERPRTRGPAPLLERTARHVLRYSPHAPASIVRRLPQDAERLLGSGRILKEGDRSTIVLLEGEGAPIVMKRFHRKGPLHTGTHLMLPSRAAWCWRNGHRLREAGLATPEPLAYVEWRLGPMRLESCVLIAYAPGPTLRDFVRSDAADRDRLDRMAAEFGRVWARLGAIHAHHDDMKASNFIVGPDDSLWLVDLDGMRIGLPGPLFRRARRVDRERFLRNWRDRPEVAAVFRARLDTA